MSIHEPNVDSMEDQEEIDIDQVNFKDFILTFEKFENSQTNYYNPFDSNNSDYFKQSEWFKYFNDSMKIFKSKLHI